MLLQRIQFTWLDWNFCLWIAVISSQFPSEISSQNAKIIFILFTSYLLLPRTVEKLWKITEELNILYKDNWTSLADREIAIFQTELLASGLVSNPDQSGTKCWKTFLAIAKGSRCDTKMLGWYQVLIKCEFSKWY